jgi:hypothetical protein
MELKLDYLRVSATKALEVLRAEYSTKLEVTSYLINYRLRIIIAQG